ncbi:MAG TPA: hypothetical protein VN769_05355 [Xanthobacteraceae bacterium]|nr:hypothetical protein [Xanthobacteraceae bacterium]
MSIETEKNPGRSPSPTAERMRLHRRRRRLKRRLVKIEIDPSEVDGLVKRGYLDPKQRDDLHEIEGAANTFFSDALTS